MNVSSVSSSSINFNQNSIQKTESKSSFADVLQGYLQNVDSTVKQAEDLTTKAAAGEVDNIHNVTIASEKAKLALEMTVAVRDKAVESYSEIMRMQF
ncbi:flagellar hook-basal body complex protein FliE [Neobacillus ginsengisoli]|uniref:Flagellar hook-basal body complex protein FliE n=1 Tax=Neobacillus ginsengisoli TaxID=904295 RepID=A0ABT9XVF5_9BACI|nr:flagellar hook-basal body complex protein FliE [Neobacillus ginsengisoli]MDQ0199555.1 flagellar hook-basal body complex protein FliE [Neobacillus ginsengisoli]